MPTSGRRQGVSHRMTWMARGTRSLWWALSAASVAAACGSRTGDELAAGSGGATAFGAGGTSGLVTNATGVTSSGFGAGGGLTAGSVTGNTAVGFATAMGIGVATSTTGGGCNPGNCRCPDCYSECECRGGDAEQCRRACFGAGGSFGMATTNTVSVGAGGASAVTVTASATSAGGSGGMLGSCCVANASAGCDDPDVASCVCGPDPFCCRVAWDQQCVREVDTLNCGRCSSPMTGAGGASTVSTVTSGTGMGGMGGGGLGDCCEVSSRPGCESLHTTACVCRADDYCCDVAWDALCVAQVELLGCGSCDGTSGAGGMGGNTSTTTTSGEGGGGGVAECIAQADGECEACLCSSCFRAFGSCIGDFGCPRILECFDETQCSGDGCYEPETCQSVIDQFGGLNGASLRYASALLACAVRGSCPCD